MYERNPSSLDGLGFCAVEPCAVVGVGVGVALMFSVVWLLCARPRTGLVLQPIDLPDDELRIGVDK